MNYLYIFFEIVINLSFTYFTAKAQKGFMHHNFFIQDDVLLQIGITYSTKYDGI